MAFSFSQLQEIKNRIVRDLSAQQGQLATHKAGFAVVDAALGGMQTTYGGWAGEVNAYLTANPSNAAALALKAEKDALVAEFAAARTAAQAADAAVNG